ncbi:MAG: protein kinase [Anaerolineaceae bacterium]|nr:protein kinase [Anaerolineaceae bacterium]
MELIGQRIAGRYRMIEKLDAGGMSIIYLAQDEQLPRQVVVKIIQTEMIPPMHLTQVRQRFQREARVMANLEHPNIIKVFDYGEHQGEPYLVMEYFPGGTLAQYSGHRVPYQQAAEMLVPIASALEYAHQQNIIHRDVKPSNILIGAEERFALADFGVAKVLETQEMTSLTRTGMTIGTPEYMAPEQCLGDPVSPQTDIYALGVIFYELVTGKRPFTGLSTTEVLVKQINEQPLPARQLNASLPPQVEAVLKRALAKDPARRFASMEIFRQMLMHLAHDRLDQIPLSIPRPAAPPPNLPPTPPGELTPQPNGQPARKNWTLWIAIASGLFLIGCFILAIYLALPSLRDMFVRTPTMSIPPTDTVPAISVLTDEPTQTEEPSPTATLETPTGTPAPTETPTPTITFTITPSPTITFTASPTPVDWRHGKLVYAQKEGDNHVLYVLNLADGSSPRKLFPAQSGLRAAGAVFSPDGSQVAFYSYGDAAYLMNTNGQGSPRKLAECDSPSWSPDGTQILCVAYDTLEMSIYNVSDGSLASTLGAGSIPSWSDSGERVAYVRRSGDQTGLYWLSLSTLASEKLVDTGSDYAPRWSPGDTMIAYQSKSGSVLSEIWLLLPSTGDHWRMTYYSDDGEWARSPDWSPDSKWVAYVSNKADSAGANYGEIFLMNVENGQEIQITQTGGAVYDWRVDWGK